MTDTTETSMRERIALALATAIDPQTEWDDLTLEQEGWIFQLTDAVLDAMREPTKVMTCAGVDQRWKEPRNIAAIYRAMIDAAKEGK